jgi:SPP1 gp7 family putative phage head morphogenesis protein
VPYTASSAPDYVPKSKRRQFADVWNSAYSRAKAKGKSDADAESLAFAESNSVAGPHAAKKYEKLLAKINEEDARNFSDLLLAAIEAEWQNLPVEIQPALESASLAGVGQGMLQIEFSNAGLIASANDVARSYAQDRAAELVGMRRDLEGNLVENPDARWAISDTTREKIREIVAESFTEDTPLDEVKDAIQEALEEEATGRGIFSEERAELIARTEVSNAQNGGNYSVWRESDVVATIRWITAEDELVCPTCEDNDNKVVRIGQPFPSGDLYPGAHPLCRCGVVVHSMAV